MLFSAIVIAISFIMISGRRQAATLHEKLVRFYFVKDGKRLLFTSNLRIIIIFWKTTRDSSSRATCALLLSFGKRQAAALHEQLVRCYYLRKTTSSSSSRATSALLSFGKRQAAALHELLVRYHHWKTTSGSSSRATCTLLLFWNTASGSFFI